MLVKIIRTVDEWLNPAQIIERNRLIGYTVEWVADNEKFARENLWQISGKSEAETLQDFAILRPEIFSGDWIEYVANYDASVKAQRQDAKPLKLKQAENAFLMLVATVPGVQPGDNSDALTAKIEVAENLSDNEKTSLGLKLLNAIHEVELAGGSWYDLPSTLHNIEV